MNFKPIIYVVVGFALSGLSKSLDLQGDLAPVDPSGVSPERAKYHIAALVVLVGSLGFFIAALASFLRGLSR